MTEQRFWTLISLKLAGEASYEEKEDLNEYLSERPEMQLRAATMENFWNAHSPVSTDTIHQSYTRHIERMKGNAKF